MFFAENSNKVTLKIYFDLISELIDKKHTAHKSFIDSIILTTADVSRHGGDNLDQVDSSIFYVVNELYHSNADYFSTHVKSEKDINSDVYLSMKAFLGTLVSSESKYM